MTVNLLQTLTKTALSPVSGRRRYQPIFEPLHTLSLYGLNIGRGERNLLRQLAAQLDSPGETITVVDVGGNVGDYTREVLDVFKDRVHVWTLEPSRPTFAMLQRTLGSDPRVTLVNAGLGDAPEETTLFSIGDGSGFASLYMLQVPYGDMHACETVSIATLDDFCSVHDIEHIHLLKLDIEGNEFRALRGGATMLSNGSIDYIQFEFGSCNVYSHPFFKDFYDYLCDNYQFYRVLQDGVYPITKYEYDLDAFKRATNYLAAHRSR